ncbi:MAG: hypothetical protein RBS39_10930 [Phycisphaerales bacterium]|jgi:HEAT repeat protein|nr:hypothetical protein [Phycisphaerales bacterium]
MRTGGASAIVAWGAAIAASAGCSHSEGTGFESLSPRERAVAAVRAGDARDASAIDDLIRMLDSDDPAERFAAIDALESITGETLGYNPSARASERDAAVVRWVDWRRADAAGASGQASGDGGAGSADAGSGS